MKRLAIFFLSFLFLVTSHVYAAPSQYINDLAGVLTPDQVGSLNNLVNENQKQSGNEIAVLIIPELKNETIESQAVKTFEEWGIGEKGKDNGVLLLISFSDRQLRIEVGYGLEDKLTDLKSNQIIRDIIAPQFKSQNYFQGIEKGLKEIISITNGTSMVPETTKTEDFNISEGLVSFFIFFGYLIFMIIARTRSWWLGGVIGALVGIWYQNIITILILTILGLVIDFILSKLGQNPTFINTLNTISRMSSSRSGGGGGFGGFGGGRSGGGGSSGKW